MFKMTNLFLYGLSETQKLIQSKISQMEYYFLIEGTKKDIISKYGFTKETTNQFIRITKVGWACFKHDVGPALKNDEHIEVPTLIDPPKFGWAVLESDVPDEVVGFLLDEGIKKYRLVESRSNTYVERHAGFMQHKKKPSTITGMRWDGCPYEFFDYSPVENLSTEIIDQYLSELSLSELMTARLNYLKSLSEGKHTYLA